MELGKKFEVVACLTSFLAAQRDSGIVDAQKLVTSASRQMSQDVTIENLAQFKTVLPDEIIFEYQDTPFDAAFEKTPPQQVLVFQFADKYARTRKRQEIPAIITGRITRFRKALAKFDDKIIPGTVPPNPLEQSKQTSLPASKNSELDCIRHEFEDGCVSQRTVPGRPARYGPTPREFAQILSERGYEKLYLHQSMALNALLQGKHVIVSTPTASGKSLIFHTPVLQALRDDENATAIFIYPTKALAQDQLRALGLPQFEAATFDGDTPIKIRDQIADSARVLFCNPDILHTTMLPQADRWHRIFSGLRYIVLDEVHYYSGVFGSHVAMVVRRLRRMASAFGAVPQLIGCSATIQAPGEHMSILSGIPSSEIADVLPEDDGSPCGTKHFVFRITEHMSPDDPSSGFKHPISEVVPAMTTLLRRGLRVITFTRYRRECELCIRALYNANPDLETAVKSYRGGYSARDRREIEASMFSGELRGIVATTALEIGIDIGNLDAVVIQGFPHSLASFRQQVGRVGRRSDRESLVLYIAAGNVMDQVYAHNIAKVLDEPVPYTPLNLNESIVRIHVQCAAHELAFSSWEDPDITEFFPMFDHQKTALARDAVGGTLGFPNKPKVSLRKADEAETLVIDTTNPKEPVILESIEFSRVGFTLYEGAIFVHQGKAYMVIDLDADLEFAKVQRTLVKWTTRQRDYTDVDPVKTSASTRICNMWPVCQGPVRTTTTVFGYFKFDQNNQIIDSVDDVAIPPYSTLRAGMWINVPHDILRSLSEREYHIAGSIHAAEHAIMSTMPTVVAMAPNDVGSECKAPEKEFAKRQTNRIRPARLIFYEKDGGAEGYGTLSAAFTQIDNLIGTACDAVDSCDCEDGCARCVAWGLCTEHNAVISKRGAQLILRSLLSRSLDSLPEGPEPNLPRARVETITAVGAETTPLSPKRKRLKGANYRKVKAEDTET